MEIVTGTFKPNQKGFGFINNESLSVFVAPRLARGYFFGDVVSCEASVDETGRMSAHSITLHQSPRRRLAATIVKGSSGLEAVPEWGPVPNIALTKTGLPAREGDRVVVEITTGDNMVQWYATVCWNGGPISTKNIESEIAMAELNIPGLELDLDQETAEAISSAVINTNNEKFRRDLTHIDFFTIDGVSTRDIDDAIHVEKTETGFILRVAIADVAQYVKKGSLLDKSAFERGTTVYFSQQTIAMLPPALSNGSASLKPHTDKLALVATMVVDTQGAIIETTIEECWIRSSWRLNYDEVSAAFAPEQVATNPVWKTLLEPLRELYAVLLVNRISRGSSPIREGDYELDLNIEGKVVNIVHRPWSVAYGFVEECMLAANTSVAKWLQDRNLPGIFRHHNGPDMVVWAQRRKYFESIGLESEEFPTPQGLVDLTAQSFGTDNAQGVENAVRGSMRPAQYCVDKSNHFSLGYDQYTHFTSPLRRGVDLEVHRVIKAYLRNEPTPSIECLEEVAHNSTLKDLRAKVATRSEMKRLKLQYAQKWVGQTTVVDISGGNNAGWFVKTSAWHIDGFAMHKGDIRRAWTWSDDLQKASREGYSDVVVGTKVKAELKNIDLAKLRVEFEADYATLGNVATFIYSEKPSLS